MSASAFDDEGHKPKSDPRRIAVISQGFETLLARESEFKSEIDKNAHFDVVIVGSGYGGAIAAAELAGCTEDGKPISVCVLERGSEYLPGMFPSRLAELPKHVRFTTPNSSQAGGQRTGLFDVRTGGDVNALVANGLGGGSLINAGVMADPADEVFNDKWPKVLQNKKRRRKCYDTAKRRLGALVEVNGKYVENTVKKRRAEEVTKGGVLRTLAAGGGDSAEFHWAPLSTLLLEQDSRRRPLKACIDCGDCATGCNHGAKNSLDVNLLEEAYRRDAKIFTCATVLRILRGGPHEPWSLEVVHTDARLRVRQGAPFKLRARKVILAAGTFGSTEILLRSSGRTFGFSPRLGQGFSANGDTITALYNHGLPEANAVANESFKPGKRGVGPTITGIVSARIGDGSIVIEDLAIPGPLRRVFEEVISTANILHTLDKPDEKAHSPTNPDPCAVDHDAIRRTSILAMMGNDGARGAIELIGGDADTDGDGAVLVRWPEIRTHKLFEQQLDVLEKLAKKSGIGGSVLPNPMWRFVPKELEELFGNQRGAAFTVHPLGGCAMGERWNDGVVDEYGRVFRPGHRPRKGEKEPVWPGLVVLDGSVVPTALGTNPALTIAVLALRAVRKLRRDSKLEWKQRPYAKHVPERHEFREPEPVPAGQNLFELVERVSGKVMLAADGRRRVPHVVDLTLRFEPFPLSSIIDQQKQPLKLKAGELRISEIGKEGLPVRVPLTGTLTVFRRSASGYKQRRCRALWAWARNRGGRDTLQWMVKRLRKGAEPAATDAHEKSPGFIAAACNKLRNAKALASHAGEERLLEYELEVGDVDSKSLKIAGLKRGARIEGIKRLTYARRANPWRQLQTIELRMFPGLDPRSNRELTLDLRYFRDEKVPLMRIAAQQDQPAALADLISFLSYTLRLMILVHIWSFRRPETPEPREPQRLPGVLRAGLRARVLGADSPVITELDVDETAAGTPVRVRLTRYKRSGTLAELSKLLRKLLSKLLRKPSLRVEPRPVVLIHGYSASGTTFAHDAVRPNLVRHLLGRRRDVWVVDLRTSSGMPTARMPWTFEDAALVDIPAAIDHVVRTTRKERRKPNLKVDVIAHCMGSAMFSMAVLARLKAGEKFSRQRADLPRSIHRVVLSQVGPIVEFSPANGLRGYVMGYIRQFLPLQRYDFRPSQDPSLTDQLIDRLLATLPYPKEEFDIENPSALTFWRPTSWVGTRHRMDALYARDFNLVNIPQRVLKYIDDLFGPLNIDTVSQGIHFARLGVITDRAGHNVYVSNYRLKQCWKFRTLSVHGVDNGLADVATLECMERGFKAAGIGRRFEKQCFDGFGHQDSLIGRGAGAVFEAMTEFLERTKKPGARSCPANKPELSGRVEHPLRVPWLGPHLGPTVRRGNEDCLPIRLAKYPGRERAEFPLVLPVKMVNDRFVLPRKTDRQFLPPDDDNPPDWGRVQAPNATPDPDRDEWIRIEQSCSPLAGADGCLVLLLDELPASLSLALPDLSRVRSKLRSKGVKLSLAAKHPDHLILERDPAATETDTPDILKGVAATLTPDERDAIIKYLDTVRGLVLDLLKKFDSKELLPALINAPEHRDDLCFAFGSCQYPAGLLDAVVADRSMELLEARLNGPEECRPRFLLQVGDQVYVDATAGLFDPTSAFDRYGRTYERLYERKVVQSVLRRLPSYNMLDDHEIDDNWEPGTRDAQPDPRLMSGRRSYWRYQRFDNFDNPVREFEHDLSFDIELKRAGAPFYVLDTRTRRSARTAESVGTAEIVDEDTFKDLIAWFGKQKDLPPTTPKFIACPALPLPRHLRSLGDDPTVLRDDAAALRSDGWDGYPRSLRRLLGYIAIHQIDNVVFLSGDEHLSLVAGATLKAEGKRPVTVHSIHSSAMYAPFPFANGDRADFATTDHFKFRAGEPEVKCTCSVEWTRFAPPGDGFAVLSKAANSNNLVCEFVRSEHLGYEVTIPMVGDVTAK